jgi:hypothetical protein
MGVCFCASLAGGYHDAQAASKTLETGYSKDEDEYLRISAVWVELRRDHKGWVDGSRHG